MNKVKSIVSRITTASHTPDTFWKDVSVLAVNDAIDLVKVSVCIPSGNKHVIMRYLTQQEIVDLRNAIAIYVPSKVPRHFYENVCKSFERNNCYVRECLPESFFSTNVEGYISPAESFKETAIMKDDMICFKYFHRGSYRAQMIRIPVSEWEDMKEFMNTLCNIGPDRVRITLNHIKMLKEDAIEKRKYKEYQKSLIPVCVSL